MCREPRVGSSRISFQARLLAIQTEPVAGRDAADADFGRHRADHRALVRVDPSEVVVDGVGNPDVRAVRGDGDRLDARRDRVHQVSGLGVDDRERVGLREIGIPVATGKDRGDGGREQKAAAEGDREGAPSARAKIRKRAPAGRGGDRRILVEDRPLELLQIRARLEAELSVELAARLAVCLERLGLAARPVEGEHQLRAQPLAGWVIGNQPLELRDQRLVPPEGEVGVDPILDRDEPPLLESRDLVLGERLVREVGERRAAP